MKQKKKRRDPAQKMASETCQLALSLGIDPLLFGLKKPAEKSELLSFPAPAEVAVSPWSEHCLCPPARPHQQLTWRLAWPAGW